MGFEWSLKLNNKALNETIPFIQKCLCDEGVKNFDVNSRGISVPSTYDGWSEMEFTLYDDYLYCIYNGGVINWKKVIARVEQILDENGFDFTLEEL